MRSGPGRTLISLVAIFCSVTAVLADFNQTHLFNPRWTPHARFHNALGLSLALGLTAFALWLLWRKSGDAASNLKAGALAAGMYFAAFLPASLVPGVKLADAETPMPVFFGVAANLAISLVCVVLIGAGYFLAALQDREASR